MPERTYASVHIGQLNLRIPGQGAEAGHRVANDIARTLAERIPSHMRARLGALSVRVQAAAGATEVELSNAITNAMMNSLRDGSLQADSRGD